MKPVPFPTCTWVTENLLVGGIGGFTVELPAAAVKGLRSAGVDWIINLLSKEQFVSAGSDALFGGLTEPLVTPGERGKTKIFVSYCFWSSGEDVLPTARQVRLTLDDIDEAHAGTVEHWLRVLPTVRVYPEGREGRCFTVPVEGEKRVSNGTIRLELDDLHAGTWVGERTLRLLDGTVVVFISASRKPSG